MTAWKEPLVQGCHCVGLDMGSTGVLVLSPSMPRCQCMLCSRYTPHPLHGTARGFNSPNSQAYILLDHPINLAKLFQTFVSSVLSCPVKIIFVCFLGKRVGNPSLEGEASRNDYSQNPQCYDLLLHTEA